MPDLQKLPAGYTSRSEIPTPLPVCPNDAPVKAFHTVAMDYPAMKFNPKAPDAVEVNFERKIQVANPEAKIYALEDDVATVAGGFQPMPLTLRANIGDCLKITLTNKMKNSRTSFSAISLAFDPKDSLGANVGRNPGDQTIAPGERRVYTSEWPIEPFMDGADGISVVEFAGSETFDAFIRSAGGPYRLPGDYVWSNQRLPYSQSGQWGYLRLLPTGDARVLSLSHAVADVCRAEVSPLQPERPVPTTATSR